MAKCNACGELNNEKSLFCSQCGKQLEKQAPSSEELNLDKVRKEFEKDSQIHLDRSKITFVCELCGTINRIDSPRCVRCGKPRPRSEFVSALRRIKDADVVQQEYQQKLEEEQRLLEEERRRAEEELIQNPISEPVKTVFRYEPKPQQNIPVTQPFVVVPYVNSAQPLWQYSTTPQISRYTGEVESLSQLQRLTKLKEEKQKEIERQLEIENRRKLYGYDEEADYGAEKLDNAKSKPIVRGAVFTLIFTIITLIGLAVYAALNFDVLKDLVTRLTNDLSGWKLYFIPAGILITLVFGLISAIKAIIKIMQKNGYSKGVLSALLMLIGGLAMVSGALFDKNVSFDKLDGMITQITKLHFSYYVIVAGALLTFIAALFCAKNKKVKR